MYREFPKFEMYCFVPCIGGHSLQGHTGPQTVIAHWIEAFDWSLQVMGNNWRFLREREGTKHEGCDWCEMIYWGVTAFCKLVMDLHLHKYSIF